MPRYQCSPTRFCGTEDFDEFAELVGDDAPSHPKVPAERERFVLKRDENLPQAGVDAVAQREVDDAIRSTEIHGRLGAFFRERVEALAYAPRKYHHKHVVEHVMLLSLSRLRIERASAFQDHARRGAVPSRDSKRKAVKLVHAGLGFGQVQPLDDDH